MSVCVWKPVLALSLPHPERALKPNGGLIGLRRRVR